MIECILTILFLVGFFAWYDIADAYVHIIKREISSRHPGLVAFIIGVSLIGVAYYNAFITGYLLGKGVFE